MNIFFEYEDFADIFWGSVQNWTGFRSHFYGLLKFQIYFWVCLIFQIHFGVNSRCWVQAYV